jgi:hypothetical protein
MAWTKTAEGRTTGSISGQTDKKEYLVYSTTLTPTGQSQVEDVTWTPVIDFIPPGTDFTVIANTAASNLSASAHIELFVGYDRTAPVPVKDTALLRYRDYVTPFIRVTSEIDNASKILFRDVSANGQYPYYWLKYATGGTTSGGTGGNTVIIKVIIGKPERAIKD